MGGGNVDLSPEHRQFLGRAHRSLPRFLRLGELAREVLDSSARPFRCSRLVPEDRRTGLCRRGSWWLPLRSPPENRHSCPSTARRAEASRGGPPAHRGAFAVGERWAVPFRRRPRAEPSSSARPARLGPTRRARPSWYAPDRAKSHLSILRPRR